MRALIVIGLGLSACSASTYSIPFAANVAGAPFSCTQTYPNIGTTHTTIAPLDLRLFVSDVTLVETSGKRVPLELATNDHQGDAIALLDFEDGTGTCATESPETYTTIVGTTSAEHVASLELTVGVPLALDHLEIVTATGPLSEPAMFWSWLAGYKYVKADVRSTGNPSWAFHLGAQTCSAASDASLVCKFPNLAIISLPAWHEGATVGFDLAALFATSDLDAQPTATDATAGCVSTDGDPQCAPLFGQLGLQYEGQGTPPTQVVFGVE